MLMDGGLGLDRVYRIAKEGEGWNVAHDDVGKLVECHCGYCTSAIASADAVGEPQPIRSHTISIFLRLNAIELQSGKDGVRDGGCKKRKIK